MAQYTVYAINPLDLAPQAGTEYSREDLDQYQTLINEQIALAGLEHEASVIITEDARLYNSTDSLRSDDRLSLAIQMAYALWMNDQQQIAYTQAEIAEWDENHAETVETLDD